jgi:hypothetical protein
MSAAPAASTIPGYVVGTWDADTVHSEVSFVIRHMVVSKVRGRFDKFEATIITAEDPLQSSVEATIEAGSINTVQEQRDDHIRSADFLDAENHPNITFVSRSLRPDGEKFLVDGDLTIRGASGLRRASAPGPPRVVDLVQLDIAPLSGTIGAEIRNIDLHNPSTAETLGAVRQALLDYKVIFFPGQHLSPAEHKDFAAYFGDRSRWPTPSFPGSRSTKRSSRSTTRRPGSSPTASGARTATGSAGTPTSPSSRRLRWARSSTPS